jgi:hypothetical protein
VFSPPTSTNASATQTKVNSSDPNIPITGGFGWPNAREGLRQFIKISAAN